MGGNDMTVLTSQRLTLRPPVAEDAKARFKLGNFPEIHRLFGGASNTFRPLTEEAAEAWVGMLLRDKHAWVILYDGKLVGSIRLSDVNPADRRATLLVGILDPDCLGKGIGSEAMRLVAGYAFDTLKLHRIFVRVIAFNDRAIAAYQKIGFQLEGRLREAAFIDGTYYDDLMMGLLEHEFERDGS
jgi:RimJ/RimL family protein N-acetyltransferase